MRARVWLATVVLTLGLAACDSGVDSSRIENTKPGEWLTYGLNYDEQRYSPLTQVNKDSVGKLGLAWWAAFDTDRGQEATPLVHDGVLYTTTVWSKVAAFDAKTGKPAWSTQTTDTTKQYSITGAPCAAMSAPTRPRPAHCRSAST